MQGWHNGKRAAVVPTLHPVICNIEHCNHHSLNRFFKLRIGLFFVLVHSEKQEKLSLSSGLLAGDSSSADSASKAAILLQRCSASKHAKTMRHARSQFTRGDVSLQHIPGTCTRNIFHVYVSFSSVSESEIVVIQSGVCGGVAIQPSEKSVRKRCSQIN